ncbi:MAG: hypothetical protein NTU44_00535 [Bacteroidetes bacterium]|nr:hypothetical protein [Bacteroidota bacterium]
MDVELRLVRTRSDLRKFIHLPAEIHKDHPNWLPPVYVDEWNFFNPQKNKAFSHCDTLMLLAFRGQKAVGRIMGIIHNSYNQAHNEKFGRFGFLECYNDPTISHALISHIEEWAREKGMEKIIGPYGFCDKDPQGLMIEGFQYPPVLAAPCNEEYMVSLVENEGYEKEVDCQMFWYDLNHVLPKVYDRIFQRVSANPEYRLLELTRRRDLKPYIIPLLKMMNEAYSHIYGFVPMDEEEMKEFADRYLPIVNPRFVKLVLHNGIVVAFLLGIPSLTKGIQRSKGYLFPFGLIHILCASRLTRQLDLMLGGVRPDHQRKGLEILMSMRLIKSAIEADYKNFEVHLVLETNRQMIAEMQKAGARPHKRFRVFKKML